MGTVVERERAGGATGQAPVPPPRPPQRTGALVVKTALMALVDGLGIYIVLTLATDDRYVVAGIAVAFLAWVNVVYLRPGRLPAKYLTPGLALLAFFQVFVVAYTLYIATTNYGDGHNVSRASAVASILTNSAASVPSAQPYRVRVLERDGALSLLATDPGGKVRWGDATTPLEDVGDVQRDATGNAIGRPGYRTLALQDLFSRQREVVGLSVRISENATDGLIRTTDGSLGRVFRSTKRFDASRDAIVDTRTREIYRDNGQGNFVSARGDRLEPGWRTSIGLQNFDDAIGSGFDGPLLRVLAWTIAFATLSVAIAFSIGTFLAIVLNDPKLRFRRLYRSLLVLPYAFPVFLSGLVWSGMLNPEFGFINQSLLGGADIGWLQDPWLARLSVVVVSVWLSFPYFFLVSTGALQSIPADVEQAAMVDGASPWRLFRFVRLPLLLVSTSPLLIAAFAYSFNDFNTIFMLTGGGPTDAGAGLNAGSTDILITVVYKQAFGTAGGAAQARDYGLASAYAVVIFLIVSLISVVLFRRTKSLEDRF